MTRSVILAMLFPMSRSTAIFIIIAAAILAGGGYLLASIDHFARAEKMFERGEYVSAFQEYMDLAEGGDARAQYALAKIYEEGLGPNIYDPDLAFDWLQRSANNNYALAQMEIGDAYYTGDRWLNYDPIGAETWWGKAAENNIFEAWYKLRSLYPAFDSDAGEPQLTSMPDNAFRLLKNAEDGHVYAMVLTGYFYFLGAGTEQDLVQAQYWFETAAKSESAFALYGLGQLLVAEQKELERAKKLIKKAADYGDTFAQVFLLEDALLLADTQSQEMALFWAYVIRRQNIVKLDIAMKIATLEDSLTVEKRREIQGRANQWRAAKQPQFVVGAQGVS